MFSSLKDVKVIQFSSMQEAFGGFTDKVGSFVLLYVAHFLLISSLSTDPLCCLWILILLLGKGREVPETYEEIFGYMVLYYGSCSRSHILRYVLGWETRLEACAAPDRRRWPSTFVSPTTSSQVCCSIVEIDTPALCSDRSNFKSSKKWIYPGVWSILQH